LEIETKLSSHSKRIYLIKNVPTFKPFILQSYAIQLMHRSVSIYESSLSKIFSKITCGNVF